MPRTTASDNVHYVNQLPLYSVDNKGYTEFPIWKRVIELKMKNIAFLWAYML